ncbi:hypothetical protein AMTR_s00034p00063060 [Amborella trichopoda]|uniref:Uncharacterized protein n=1 Tax=Amborella trichopoda TaxID=13333 RepID=W1PWE7_AMBTC|nr:hypothetical protein AMTR_s00034p00063060 [Amborella trichopoda]
MAHSFEFFREREREVAGRWSWRNGVVNERSSERTGRQRKRWAAEKGLVRRRQQWEVEDTATSGDGVIGATGGLRLQVSDGCRWVYQRIRERLRCKRWAQGVGGRESREGREGD